MENQCESHPAVEVREAQIRHKLQSLRCARRRQDRRIIAHTGLLAFRLPDFFLPRKRWVRLAGFSANARKHIALWLYCAVARRWLVRLHCMWPGDGDVWRVLEDICARLLEAIDAGHDVSAIHRKTQSRVIPVLPGAYLVWVCVS